MRALNRAAAVATVLLLAMLVIRYLTLEKAPLIHVRWAPQTGTTVRAPLERQFSLSAGSIFERDTWSYTLLDTSRSNVRSLIRHPLVRDTGGLDREAFAVRPSVERSSTQVVWLIDRSGFLRPLGTERIVTTLATIMLVGFTLPAVWRGRSRIDLWSRAVMRRTASAGLAGLRLMVRAAIAIALLECVAIAGLTLRDARFVPASTRFTEARGAALPSACTPLESLFPHPYLAYVLYDDRRCRAGHVSNVGTIGADVPIARSDEQFVILLTGGSMAAELAEGMAGGVPYLQRMLNDAYESPNGKPFLVVSGAVPGWHQPQQTIMALLNIRAVHAVVALDGFAEHEMLRGRRRFDAPNADFEVLNPLATENFGQVGSRWIAERMTAEAAATPVISQSHLAYAVVTGLGSAVQRLVRPSERPRTSLATMFGVPPQWSADDVWRSGLDQYAKYVRLSAALSRANGVLYAHFIQPVAATGKTLTADERRAAGAGDGDSYRRMSAELQARTAGHAYVESLVDAFTGERRSIYRDAALHLRSAEGTSVGDDELSHRIADSLARAWRLRGKS